MTNWIDTENEFFIKLKELGANDVIASARPRDGTTAMLKLLARKYPTSKINQNGADHVWELAGLLYLTHRRFYEALAIFLRLYEQKLKGQQRGGRTHKGMPLMRISEIYRLMGFPVHATRYLMLALCEDAITSRGDVSPNNVGSYFNLVWFNGLTDTEFRRYVSEFWLRSEDGAEKYPEALLQLVDTSWMTSVASHAEAFHYVVNREYVNSLMEGLGKGDGKALEDLATYLLSCMPGCRVKKRAPSPSTDYDVVCTMEGFDLDFRSELGRYFVCECKDWKRRANFTTMAKFCRVLDSTKARFGILFAKKGLTGLKRTTGAARERMKIYQDRGIVIVTIDQTDLQSIANGGSLIALLRDRYESVRLDLR